MFIYILIEYLLIEMRYFNTCNYIMKERFKNNDKKIKTFFNLILKYIYDILLIIADIITCTL